jgi:hypothetical protein
MLRRYNATNFLAMEFTFCNISISASSVVKRAYIHILYPPHIPHEHAPALMLANTTIHYEQLTYTA